MEARRNNKQYIPSACTRYESFCSSRHNKGASGAACWYCCFCYSCYCCFCYSCYCCCCCCCCDPADGMCLRINLNIIHTRLFYGFGSIKYRYSVLAYIHSRLVAGSGAIVVDRETNTADHGAYGKVGFHLHMPLLMTHTCACVQHSSIHKR